MAQPLTIVDPDLEQLREVAANIVKGYRPAWMRDSLCAEPDYAKVVFFAGRGQDLRPAKALCARCLVRQECLDYAVANDITEGVWGGLSGQERRALGSLP